MAMCLQLTLPSRFDDCSRKARARSLDDIRISHREAVLRARYQYRCLQMLQHRPTFAETLRSSDDSDDDCFSSQDYQSSQASPAWSTLTSSTVSPQPMIRIGQTTLPSYLIELPPQTGAPRSVKNQSTSDRLATYKQQSSRSMPRSRIYQDQRQIVSNYQQFKKILATCLANDDQVQAVSTLIYDHWRLIISALNCTDATIVADAFERLQYVLNKQLITAKVAIHLVQHGIIYALRDSMFQIPNGQTSNINILLALARTSSDVLLYMIDILSSSNMVEDFNEQLVSGCTTESQSIVAFYHHVIVVLMDIIAENQQAITSSSFEPNMNPQYSVTYLIKAFKPTLIGSIIKYCITSYNKRSNQLIDISFQTLANVLKTVQLLSSDQSNCPEKTDWIVMVLCAFRDSTLEQNVGDLIFGLEQLVRSSLSSDHCSQGLGVDHSAGKTIEQCRQFLEFYHHYYEILSAPYSDLMSKIPSPTLDDVTSFWE